LLPFGSGVVSVLGFLMVFELLLIGWVVDYSESFWCDDGDEELYWKSTFSSSSFKNI